MLLPNEIGERKHNCFFLKAYFESKEKEVVDIMMALYDEEEVMKRYVESEKYKEPTSEGRKNKDYYRIILQTG